VTRLPFDKSLYAGTAVDEAVKVFGAHATFRLQEEPQAWVVEVSHADAALERRIANELGNYALGLGVGVSY
jgi:hypothetical protein